MQLTALEKVITEPYTQEIAHRTVQEAAALGLLERWVPRSKYAKHHGVTPQTVYNRTSYLRSIGAVYGEHKATRYDITVTPFPKRLKARCE